MTHQDLLGRSVRLQIVRIGAHGAFLAPLSVEGEDEAEVAFNLLLPGSEIPKGAKVGDELEVFVCLDSETRPIATTKTPKLKLGEVAFLTVTEVGPIGAFVDWGLGKELLVPFAEQTQDMRAGERWPIGLYLDDSGRLAGTMRTAEMLRERPEFAQETWVEGEALRKDPRVGIFVVVAKRFIGLLPNHEPNQLSRGEAARFRVANVLPDGKIELSLRGRAGDEIEKDAGLLLDRLRAPKPIRISDKSSPEVIEKLLGLSKKAFKRAAGSLLKKRLIETDETGCFVAKKI